MPKDSIKLTIRPVRQNAAQAQFSSKASVTGECKVNLYLNKHFYPEIHLEVFEDICSDLLLGLDFQRHHSSITIVYGGHKPGLKIPDAENNSVCGLAAADLTQLLLCRKMLSL